jgi:S1-C subfamily serine protease
MALIPPFFLNCVVALGSGSEKPDGWVGTGFLYGHLVKMTDPNNGDYDTFLVTNKHVFGDFQKLWVRFNPIGHEQCKDYPLPLRNAENKQLWVGHPDPNIDVAIIRINTKFLDSEKRNYSLFLSNLHTANMQTLIKDHATEGDAVFVLGFPMGLVAKDRQYVICRSGCIARIRDCLEQKGREFLVDAPVFPGNSGGPVVTRPEGMSIAGTTARNRADLIGIVQSYVPYRDVAISQQTRQPRIIFEENSGLTSVIPVDFITETIDALYKQQTAPLPQISESHQTIKVSQDQRH